MKKNHLIFGLSFVILVLLGVVGCQPEPDLELQTPSLPPTTGPTNTVTITQTPSTNPTRTPKPTKTLTFTPSVTIDPLNFNASTIVTITPDAPEQCPTIDSSIEFDIVKLFEFYEVDEKSVPGRIKIDVFLNYLNQGIPLQGILDSMQQNPDFKSMSNPFLLVDITGDGLDEIVFSHYWGVRVIGCMNGSYRMLGELDDDGSTFQIGSRDILDANNDGLNDIGIEFLGCNMGTCQNFVIFTWNGEEFIPLSDFYCSATSEDTTSISFEDTDNNGTKEIILYHKALANYIPYLSLFPDRDETVICMWNGSQFVRTDSFYGDPVYRMQAYTDARFSTRKHPEKAIEIYLQVIHDETLKWYVPGDEKIMAWETYLEERVAEDPDIIYDPMYDFNFKQDIYEYPLLASASYYRMMLIYLQQDDIKNAETMLVILKDAYGPGKTGQYFTQMAEIVLKNYKETGDLEQSCPSAVEYASENWEDITSPLTYLHMGYFFNDPEFWCPYLPEGYGEE
jgi:hypothetical protein